VSASPRLEKISNMMFAVMCLAVSVAAVQYVLAARTTPARRSPVAKGTRLELPAAIAAEGKPSVLLVLSTQCRFCTESMPFYTKLSKLPETREGRLRLAAITLQPVPEMQKYLAAYSLPVSAVVPIADSGFNVSATPALVVIRGDGTVVESWSGWLDTQQEQQVLSTIGKLTRG